MVVNKRTEDFLKDLKDFQEYRGGDPVFTLKKWKKLKAPIKHPKSLDVPSKMIRQEKFTWEEVKEILSFNKRSIV